jgi:NRPS condensation-like uncharacterized protein
MNKLPILNERLYLRSPGINVCFRTILEGVFDKTRIEKALEKVCKRHPLLNSAIEIDNHDNAWLVQKGGVIEIEPYKSDETDWQSWYKKADNMPFDFLRGPLVKIALIYGDNTEIIILGHHIIGDGIAWLNLVKDVLLALDNKIDTTPQIPPSEPADRYFKKTILLDDAAKSFATGLNEEWRRTGVHLSENEYRVFFDRYRDKQAPNLYMASIEADDFKKLREKGKANGLTVNEIIASAFSAATMETTGNYPNKEIRLGVAANIRAELVSEPYHCMGNYVTGISARVPYDPSDSFIVNAKAIAALLKEQLGNLKNRHLVVHFLNEFDKDLIESTMFAAYGTLNHPIAKKLALLIGEQPDDKGVGISNLGSYHFTHYENFRVVDVQFIGPAFPANLLTVGIITVNDKLNVCLRYNETEINTDSIKALYKKAVALVT